MKKDNDKTQNSNNTLQSNYLDSENFPTLLSAILNKDTKRTAELIAQGADVNQRDKSGYTPLMYAVMYNNADIVKQLLDAKADINATIPAGDKQLTALQIASANNYTDIVEFLKQAGAKE